MVKALMQNQLRRQRTTSKTLTKKSQLSVALKSQTLVLPFQLNGTLLKIK
jgi:hypothetical protein